MGLCAHMSLGSVHRLQERRGEEAFRCDVGETSPMLASPHPGLLTL